jgi:hypothetical protein
MRLGVLCHVHTRISVLSTFITHRPRYHGHDVAINIARKECSKNRPLIATDTHQEDGSLS